MGGDELFVHLRSLNDRVKFILASGFIDPAIKAKLTERGLTHVMSKPYYPVQVLTFIRAVLDEK